MLLTNLYRLQVFRDDVFYLLRRVVQVQIALTTATVSDWASSENLRPSEFEVPVLVGWASTHPLRVSLLVT